MKKALERALEVYQCSERHDTVAETRYWCAQYKLLATMAIEALQQGGTLTNEQIDSEHDKLFPAPLLQIDRVKVREFVRRLEAIQAECRRG